MLPLLLVPILLSRLDSPVTDRAELLAKQALKYGGEPRGAAPLIRLHALLDEVDDLNLLADPLSALTARRNTDPGVRVLAKQFLADLERARGRTVRAQAVLDELGLVQDWYAVGGFDNEGKGGCDTDFGPEGALDLRATYPAKGREVGWRRPGARAPDGSVDLSVTLRPNTEAVAYALAFLKADAETRAVLSFGTSGGARLFVNGVKVASSDRYNLARADQQRLQVTLRKGLNRVLLKVCGASAPLGFFFRAERAEGAKGTVTAALPDAVPPLEKGPHPAPQALPTLTEALAAKVKAAPADAELRGDYATVLAWTHAWDDKEHLPALEAEKAADARPDDVALHFGSTHGRTYTPHIKGARQEATSGVSRLMWGMGAFNNHILATVSLACMEDNGFPLIIGDIAADLPEEMWNRERHAGQLEEWCDLATGEWDVNKVTYKTPDYMLCSAQDYHPGEGGYQQHIWQATLGPDAFVFVSHPPCLSEEGSHRPNFWHGNVVLPRVAQWKDVLIAIHKLPDDDWLNFTHAYFPVWAFDEHVLREDSDGRVWAFARKGEGYLALTAAQGLELITRGDNAYRELRSHGQHNVWLCHLGRAALDGDFAEFQNKILTLDVSFDDLSVRCATLRGETLAFGWQGPLLRNGKEEPIAGFKHYDNPYCVADLPASQMEIRFGDQLMRLNFAPR